jgi:hypothetical protein
MTDTREKTQQRQPSAQPQQHGQKKTPDQNPQGSQERRTAEQVKGRPGTQESGRHQTEGEHFRNPQEDEDRGEFGHSEGEQHKEKHQGQKMPQQQKKDDQGSCGCG